MSSKIIVSTKTGYNFSLSAEAVEQAMGALLVLTGIAFLTGSINQMSVWLLEAFPVLGRIG